MAIKYDNICQNHAVKPMMTYNTWPYFIIILLLLMYYKSSLTPLNCGKNHCNIAICFTS